MTARDIMRELQRAGRRGGPLEVLTEQDIARLRRGESMLVQDDQGPEEWIYASTPVEVQR